MMKFEYLEPKSLEEVISLLTKFGNKGKVCAGGTDLVVKMKQKALKPPYVVGIRALPGLDYIKYESKLGLSIGTLTTIRSIEKSSELRERGYGILCQAASQIGYVQVRNVATVGGNLCNAAPSADMAPPLIALSAMVKIIGPAGERIVPLEAFFTGPGSTVLNTGELLTEIRVPSQPLGYNSGGIYLKHSIRGAVDLAIVGVGVVLILNPESLICKDTKIALGAVAPTPIRAYKAEDILKGKNIDDGLISRAAQVASQESQPISDVRSSAEYRGKMVTVFAKRALEAALEQAKSKSISPNPKWP